MVRIRINSVIKYLYMSGIIITIHMMYSADSQERKVTLHKIRKIRHIHRGVRKNVGVHSATILLSSVKFIWGRPCSPDTLILIDESMDINSFPNSTRNVPYFFTLTRCDFSRLRAGTVYKENIPIVYI